MPRFFNNCRARDHAAIYGGSAFYDLDRTGKQAQMATDLKRGEECVVATPNKDGDIEFVRFSCSHEKIMPDENGVAARVQFGKRLRSMTLSKAKAAKTKTYAVFFNVNSHFKRPSVIEPKPFCRSLSVRVITSHLHPDHK
jgi:hypothetical protein